MDVESAADSASQEPQPQVQQSVSFDLIFIF